MKCKHGSTQNESNARSNHQADNLFSLFDYSFSLTPLLCPDKMDQGQNGSRQNGSGDKMDLRPKLDKMDHVNLYLFFYIIFILVFGKIVCPGPETGLWI